MLHVWWGLVAYCGSVSSGRMDWSSATKWCMWHAACSKSYDMTVRHHARQHHGCTWAHNQHHVSAEQFLQNMADVHSDIQKKSNMHDRHLHGCFGRVSCVLGLMDSLSSDWQCCMYDPWSNRAGIRLPDWYGLLIWNMGRGPWHK